jgi:hypothetical protein
MHSASGAEPGSHVLSKLATLAGAFFLTRWQCVGTNRRNYNDICPLGDDLCNSLCSCNARYSHALSQDGRYSLVKCAHRHLLTTVWFFSESSAKLSYASAGPCEHTAYMQGASARDKKRFEASCGVAWPDMGGGCAHDYSASCE